ncbi:porin [Enterovibrio sp. ZSDZ35]|uniref:Porin n=1 Tax=Enterovibrio qingdaonensis TaxID=2899818 RepID=A0ABT5QQA8_9GAMM|nr:porin [Enterovibrio sp. ZSDZ35]MDD1783160.1 porin [Enterovibrio sp. ZSDZ35]
MNKKILAVAIPAAILAGNVNAFEAYSGDAGSVEVYGQLRAVVQKLENKDVKLDDGGSRTGVNAFYTVNENLNVFGTVEYSLSYSDSDSNLKNRLGYMGVSGDFGQVSFGRLYLTADDLGGIDNSYFYGGSHIIEEQVSGGKHDNAIRYVFENDAIYIDASYALPEDGTSPEVLELFVSKNLAGFDVTAGVSTSSQDHDAFTLNNVAVSAGSIDDLYYTVFAQRSFGDLSVGVQYTASSIESDATSLELDRSGYALALNYAVDAKSSLYSGVEFSDYDLKGQTIGTVDKDDLVNVYAGAVHKFNSFFRVYGEVGYRDGKTPGFSNGNSEWSVGPSAYDGEVRYALGARVYW